MKRKSDHPSNDKVKIFFKNIVIIEEEWFTDMNLTDVSKISTAPIKREK